ncbi:ATPase family protein 2 like [Pseudolycoriella hygida]|uniref:ATPase family protein 2 like n=1 Tax=Pseudolycoriella hygida TaxID=35572 RepID=A0A9Q0NAU2_9DIPT|nr:ATPase family protein 2 like [Pseudolycoriella hygida]
MKSTRHNKSFNSSSKKDEITWLLCENCTVYLSSKDSNKHGEDCPLPNEVHESSLYKYPFIQNKRFVTRLCEKTDADGILSDELFNSLGLRCLNNFVFVSETVMNLCEWTVGDSVVLQSLCKNSAPVVRKLWPVSDKTTSNAFVTAQEIYTTWKDTPFVNITKLPYDPPPATDIKILPTDPNEIDPKMYKDLLHIISTNLYNTVVCVDNSFIIEFFNKTFSFLVKHIVRQDYSSLIEDIEEKFKSLHLSHSIDKYCLVTRRTNIEIIKTEDVKEIETNVDSTDKLDSIGGLNNVITEIKEAMDLAFGIAKPMKGIEISRAILLHGHSGCGKSLLCNALAAQTDALVVTINASEIFSKYFGETEANLLQHFTKAFKNYPHPTFVVVEEIVNICAKDNKEDSSKRISSAFSQILDSIHNKKEGSRTFLLATTSFIENINPAVRRNGRFDIEIEIPVPNPKAREDILTKILSKIENTLTPDDVKHLANESTHGFVGADLSSLIRKSVMLASKKNTSDLGEKVTLTLSDIQHGLCYVKPSAMREVLIESPNVRWTDIGGQDKLKLQLKQSIEWPLTHPDTYVRLGIVPPRGILMFGPPGCSKTMIAKALATESKLNFLSIKGPELFSMWVGESERAVRDLFRKARQVAPAIIFFDEIDAIGGERSTGSSVKERVLAQLLTEMDGVNALNNVTIVAATNRPDLIDKALMRPGRIDRIVYVQLPDVPTRTEIFKIKFKNMPIAEDVNLDELVNATDGYSGAEVQAVCQEAAMKALEENIDATIVNWKHFQDALVVVQPRTNSDLLNLYEEYLKKF